MRKNYILATSGHVDHGKTSLIKALTGKDCDTHKEEKNRGITIYLGFSHIDVGENVKVGIVDVPGHKDFINTMISGVNGIDLVLFIIAADECFMPQTDEHLQILQMLGVKKGLIIITKCDLINKDTYFLVKEEIQNKVKNSFLEKAAIIGVSVRTGKNLDKIKTKILQLLKKKHISHTFVCPAKKDTANVIRTKLYSYSSPFCSKFRLYPDRFFQVKGFGSVVTGTVKSGQIDKSKILFSALSDKEYKIRKIEAHGIESQIVSQGQRASLNISNFDKEDFERGMMLCSEPYSLTALIDVKLSLLDNISYLTQWSTVEFFTATATAQAKIHLLDKDSLYPNEHCYAQLHLNKAIAVCYGDMYLIRNSSGMQTLGGGKVIDAFPLHHKRRTEKVKELLRKRGRGTLQNLICTEIDKSIKPISIEQISKKLFKNFNVSDLTYLPEKYTRYENWFWHSEQQDRLETRLVKYIQIAHQKNPLDNKGKGVDELISLVGDFPVAAKSLIIKKALENLLQKGIIEKRKDTFGIASHRIKLLQKDHDQINWVDQFILNQRMQVPLWSELRERAFKREIDESRLKQILIYLVAQKRLIHFDGIYLHCINVAPLRKTLILHLSKKQDGISIGEFRDLIKGNRKICLVLLNIFDNEGIIKRVDDKRFLTEKGKILVKDVEDRNTNIK